MPIILQYNNNKVFFSFRNSGTRDLRVIELGRCILFVLEIDNVKDTIKHKKDISYITELSN